MDHILQSIDLFDSKGIKIKNQNLIPVRIGGILMPLITYCAFLGQDEIPQELIDFIKIFYRNPKDSAVIFRVPDDWARSKDGGTERRKNVLGEETHRRIQVINDQLNRLGLIELINIIEDVTLPEAEISRQIGEKHTNLQRRLLEGTSQEQIDGIWIDLKDLYEKIKIVNPVAGATLFIASLDEGLLERSLEHLDPEMLKELLGDCEGLIQTYSNQESYHNRIDKDDKVKGLLEALKQKIIRIFENRNLPLHHR